MGVATATNSQGGLLAGLSGVALNLTNGVISGLADTGGNYRFLVPPTNSCTGPVANGASCNYDSASVDVYDPITGSTLTSVAVDLSGISTSTPFVIFPILATCNDPDATNPDADDPDCDIAAPPIRPRPLVSAQRITSATSSAASFALAPACVAPALESNPTTLVFSATKAGAAGTLSAVTPAQTIVVQGFSGYAVPWTASVDQPWVTITHGSGTGSGTLTVSISDPTNSLGGTTTATATITVTAPTFALASTIPVTLNVYAPTAVPPPSATWTRRPMESRG